MRHVTRMSQGGGGLSGTMTMTGEAPGLDISAPLRTDADVLKRVGFLIDEPDRLHRSPVFLTSAANSGREHALSRRLAQLATRPLHERCLVRNLPAGRVDAEVPEQS